MNEHEPIPIRWHMDHARLLSHIHLKSHYCNVCPITKASEGPIGTLPHS